MYKQHYNNTCVIFSEMTTTHFKVNCGFARAASENIELSNNSLNIYFQLHQLSNTPLYLIAQSIITLYSVQHVY